MTFAGSLNATVPVDDPLPFVAHAILRHAELWRRNGATVPVLAVPLVGWYVAAQGGTGRKRLGCPGAGGDGGEMAVPDDALMLTTRQTARLLQVSERTVRTMIADGRLPAIKLGAATRVPRGDVEKLVAGSPRAIHRF